LNVFKENKVLEEEYAINDNNENHIMNVLDDKFIDIFKQHIDKIDHLSKKDKDSLIGPTSGYSKNLLK